MIEPLSSTVKARWTELTSIVQIRVHAIALHKGFWQDADNKGEKIALMHAELSETLEAIRGEKDGVPVPDKHLPQFSNEVVELADCVIRIFDFCAYFNLPLAEAILAKMEFNAQRPHKHNKNF